MNQSLEPTKYLDLASEMTISPGQTISQPLYQDDFIKVVLFGFAAGQELSEHTASVPAILHFISGEATVGLGSETVEARANSFIHMPANLPHSITAHADTRMLLFLLRGALDVS